jgi:hypothetical protein
VLLEESLGKGLVRVRMDRERNDVESHSVTGKVCG